MKKGYPIGVIIVLASVLASTRAQGQVGGEMSASGQQPVQPATPAGEGNSAMDNLPLSAVDKQSLAPNSTTRSVLIPGLEVSQGVDSNASSTGASSLQGVIRVLGSLSMQSVWRRQAFDLAYVGVGSFYSVEGSPGQLPSVMQEHQVIAEHRILWRSGQLTFHDSFSYLPEGSFGNGAFGGTGNLIGISLPGIGLQPGIGDTGSSFFGSGGFGSLGQQPRITNITMADVIQELTPRSSFTLAGSYGVVHFTGNASSSVNSQQVSTVNSQQVSTQAGYNYQLTRRDQIGIIYGFQSFRYPTSIGKFTTHLANVLYGHRIAERLDLIVGGGPQATRIDGPAFGTSWTISASGQASLRLQVRKTSLALQYERYNTSGSGLFGGALSDVVSLSAARPFGRHWGATVDLGYTRNSRILPVTIGTSSREYSYVYGGGTLHRQIGHNFGVYVSYQYNQQLFDSSFCAPGSPCDRPLPRQMGLVGLDWHPNPAPLH